MIDRINVTLCWQSIVWNDLWYQSCCNYLRCDETTTKVLWAIAVPIWIMCPFTRDVHNTSNRRHSRSCITHYQNNNFWRTNHNKFRVAQTYKICNCRNRFIIIFIKLLFILPRRLTFHPVTFYQHSFFIHPFIVNQTIRLCAELLY